MKRAYPQQEELMKEYGRHKQIPDAYREVILHGLFHYPELKEVKIIFKLKDDHPVPYNTTPSIASALSFRRSYTVNILDRAVPPVESALFRNLPDEARLGVIGHELAHVLQYEGKGGLPVFKMPSGNALRQTEREADVIAIEHGLGFELYTLACFLRAIPGYLEKRKEIDMNYLHPNEILEALPPEQLHEIHH